LIESIAVSVALTVHELGALAAAAFAAGLVRGFAGFGLSAVVMAACAIYIQPLYLIPVCFMLEAAASLAMFRGGLRDADMRIVWGLAIGSMLGAPLGLYATQVLDSHSSKTVALVLVLALTGLQLAKVRSPLLSTPVGLYLSGLCAGVATGLASIGGMVVALYVLSSEVSARQMRGSLVMFLFIGMFSSTIYLLAFDMLNKVALVRAFCVAPLMFLGLLLGTQLFRPAWQGYYKPVCLSLLLLLSAVGLFRQFF